MKKRILILFALALFEGAPWAGAQGTAFTYQGQLSGSGGPANGSYDFTFTLFNTSAAGSPVVGPVTNSATAVSNGLFTTIIDFGAGVFTGASNWLEIAVRPNNSGSFGTLAPRQRLMPTPYAIVAENLAAVTQLNTVVPGEDATVAGGINNNASFYYAAIGGGDNNMASGEFATIPGGYNNNAANAGATVGGGGNNTASGYYATGGGGDDNIASGADAEVPGGEGNTAAGNDSFAAGFYAHALNNGCFVWADESGSSFSSTAVNQFSVRAAGGVLLAANVQIGTSSSDYRRVTMGGGNSTGYLYGSYPGLGDGIHLGYNFYYDPAGSPHVINSGGGTSRISAGYGTIVLATGVPNANNNPPGDRLDINTTTVSVNNATFNNNSDRNVKQDFTPVSPLQILDKVAQLPVTEWSYKFDSATRHIGPMAQDFYAAFSVGTDDRHIAPIDEGGVAFLAIQGLNQRLNDKEAEIQKLEKNWMICKRW